MATTTAEKLFTAEEYARLPDNGQPTELVRGRIVPVNPPNHYHGYVCANITGILREFVRAQKLGRVLGNDSAVITERDPDTVRGADVAYYSYGRLPKDQIPKTRYSDAIPELVFEVLSPCDRWSQVHVKVGEYLAAGVNVVYVVDCATEHVHDFPAEQPPRQVTAEEVLTLPEVLGDFRVAVSEFFS
jgi:Uma2 family endonuclease